MAKSEVFHATISEEPSTGAVRGKLPGRLVQAMNAEAGDVIAMEVLKGKIVGGRVLSSREAREYKNENGRGSGSKSTAKGKADKKSAKSTGSAKSSKKAKSNKRKTSVEYDEAPKGKKKGKLKLKKKGKK